MVPHLGAGDVSASAVGGDWRPSWVWNWESLGKVPADTVCES